MFLARSKEIELIEKKIKSSSFEFGIVYGRRRIGKTSLLKEIIQRNNGIYFVANEMGIEHNLNKLFSIVGDYFNENISFIDLEMMFKHLKEKSKNERVILIIDEFTYLLTKDEGVQSVFQNIIDTYLLDSNIILILSGSQVGMIEDIVSYEKPLYGRTTFRLQLKAFDYYDASLFYPNYSYLDKVKAYSVFGGIPYYLSKIDNNLSLKENIINLIIKDDGILFEETDFFLKQELRSISSYSMIINAISSGATRLNEISTKALVNNSGTTTKYLDTLKSLDIIEREVCFGESQNSKKTIYRVKDNFFNFFYTFIHPNKTKIVLLDEEVFYEQFIEKNLDKYVSFIFEEICKEFLIRKNKTQKEDMFFEIGRFWGNNKDLKREVEIDIVTKSERGNTCFECKWTTDLFRKREYLDLKEESSVLEPVKLGGFSKQGFSEDATELLDFAFNVQDLYNF